MLSTLYMVEAYFDDALSLYDEPCEAQDELSMCPACREVGCIKQKIDQVRAAIAKAEGREP